MDYFKKRRYQVLRGPIARRVMLRAVFVVSAVSMFPLLHLLSGGNPGMMLAPVSTAGSGSDFSNLCGVAIPGIPRRLVVSFWGPFESAQCREDVNLTISVVGELIGRRLLDYGAKTLCAGEGSVACVYALQELGFSNACGVHGHPFFPLKRKRFVYDLDYEDDSFDFVFSRGLNKVSVPALLVSEIERVLRPGGVGAMLVSISDSNPNNLIRSVTPVSSLLKVSEVVHVGFMNDFTLSMAKDFTLVVFKKKFEDDGYFGQFQLPADCPAIINKQFLDFMEPLFQERPPVSAHKPAYLPSVVDVEPRKHLVYIDIGIRELMNSSLTSWFPPSYPIDVNAFKVYFVDHDTSVLSSFVKKPGITFIYHPGLAGNKGSPNIRPDPDANPYHGDQSFDLLAWFKETVSHADFVVLKMNTGDLQLKFLTDLFKSGVICSLDELFLRCDEPLRGLGLVKTSCINLFKELRSVGLFVHQWWGE